MKKITISLFALCMTGMLMYAQESTTTTGTTTEFVNKKGIPIHPKTGDYGIGIDAAPFFLYLGNFYTDNSYRPDFGFTAQNPGAIYGKYFLSRSSALRGKLIIGASSTKDKTASTDPDDPNITKTSALNIGISAGIEKQRSLMTRFTGIYGVQAGIQKTPFYDATAGTTGKVKYEDSQDSNADYTLSGGNTVTFKAGAFVGVEFFFAPKVSLSGEFDLDLGFGVTGDRKNEPGAGDEVITEPGGSAITLGIVPTGSLILNFYF